MDKKEREATVKRGVIQFRADENLTRALLAAAERADESLGSLVRHWVAEHLMDPIDDIDYLRRNEDIVYKEVREYLGDSVTLIEEIKDLYGLLSELIQTSKMKIDEFQLLGLLHCQQGCRYQFLMGNLALLRAHPIDQSSYRRKAIEYCAFAIRMLRNADSAQIWMNAISNRAYDRYEAAFPIAKSISEAEDLLGSRLKKMYGVLSQQVHASPYSIATQIRIVYDLEGNPVHTLDYFQHGSDQKKHFLALAFLSGLDHDFLIISALANAVSSVADKFDMQKWEAKHDEVRGKIQREKEKWAPTLDPGGYYRQGKKPPRK